jgi:NAD+ kinase
MHFKKVFLFGFKKEREILDFKHLMQKINVEVVEDVKDSDLIIVLGGDGSILHMGKVAHQYQIPILGVNLGHIGFLADVSSEETDVIHAILQGHYTEEPKQVLKCQIDQKTYYAINEVMVSKARAVRMIHYEVYVDDHFLYEQKADGVIIATTTGSSAYALSAGGQLIHPGAKAISIVPVCPNKITSLPLVLDENAQIEIVLNQWKDSEAVIANDAVEVPFSHQRVKISKDKSSVTFLHPLHYNYYRTLQLKLGWQTSLMKD